MGLLNDLFGDLISNDPAAQAASTSVSEKLAEQNDELIETLKELVATLQSSGNTPVESSTPETIKGLQGMPETGSLKQQSQQQDQSSSDQGRRQKKKEPLDGKQDRSHGKSTSKTGGKAGAAGGGKLSMGKMASKAGGVVGGLASLGHKFYKAGKTIHDFVMRVGEENRELGKYSAAVGVTVAELEYQKIRLDMQTAESTGNSAATLNEEIGKINDQFAPLKDDFRSMKNIVGIAGSKALRGLTKLPMKLWEGTGGKLIDAAEEYLKPKTKDRLPVDQWLWDMANEINFPERKDLPNLF